MEANGQFKFIDLFAGIGGFHMALAGNGGRCVGFSEIDKDAIEAYCENFGESRSKNFGDIRKVAELPQHDLLTAGVPCQSWSIAGRNLGFDDDRGQLWNDTVYLLQQSKPKAFIFENVKGLVDPRNEDALSYILKRIREAGYHARHYVINSYDYGVQQNRIRIYIVGFRCKDCLERFSVPAPVPNHKSLGDVLGIETHQSRTGDQNGGTDLFGEPLANRVMSLSAKNGFNDYFLFNDLRNGDTTIHSWDILEATERQKDICYLLLRNRRKKRYGKLDGNPLALRHFQSLDPSVTQAELDGLVEMDILKPEEYLFRILNVEPVDVPSEESLLLGRANDGMLVVDDLKSCRELKLAKINISKTIDVLKAKGMLECTEIRYDFKNTKISTGLFGVNRVFLPSSDIFPTLVASDTNDYIALSDIAPTNPADYKTQFLAEIYAQGNYRKITKAEACLIQGFPHNFKLPESRARWMKLIGNSVSVPVIDMLCKAVLDTGVFAGISDGKAASFSEACRI